MNYPQKNNSSDKIAAIEEIGDNHFTSSCETPLRKDAFDTNDEIKIKLIEKHFSEIMNILGLDLTDDSLSGTPRRVAKMYVKEIFSGLNPVNRPEVRLFENIYKYKEMLIEKDISFYSMCEHHFAPIIGKAHIAYKPNDKVVGLSKLNRIVRYYAKRPQVQERMTMQIALDLQKSLDTNDVAVIVEAKHLCVSMRGVKDDTSSTITSHFCGSFENEKDREELFKYLQLTSE
ncbi:MAG: GTP cyclohydrolase I FolE [Rhodothermaceae bacterium]